MARRTRQPGQAVTAGSCEHGRYVRMQVSALGRPALYGMTVEAAGILDHLAGFDEQCLRTSALIGNAGEF